MDIDFHALLFLRSLGIVTRRWCCSYRAVPFVFFCSGNHGDGIAFIVACSPTIIMEGKKSIHWIIHAFRALPWPCLMAEQFNADKWSSDISYCCRSRVLLNGGFAPRPRPRSLVELAYPCSPCFTLPRRARLPPRASFWVAPLFNAVHIPRVFWFLILHSGASFPRPTPSTSWFASSGTTSPVSSRRPRLRQRCRRRLPRRPPLRL